MKRWAAIAGACLLSFSVGAGVGWWRKPAKVVETTKTVEVVRVEYRDLVKTVEVKGPERVTERIVERPGVDRVIERVVERGPVTTTTDRETTGTVSGVSETKTAKVSINARPDWSLALGAQWRPSSLSLNPDLYDAELSRRIVGGVWLGVTATADPNDLGGSTVGLRARVEW